VKTLSGKTISLPVQPTDQVSVLKKLIEQKEKVPVAQQRIIFGEDELEDSKSLESYGIGDEDVVNLVIKKVAENMQWLSKQEQSEMKVAQSKVMSSYYNQTVGLNDEIATFKDSESKFDKHANPEGASFDLGKDGQFKEFNVLIGQFDRQCLLKDAEAALKIKGFGVIIATAEDKFIAHLKGSKIHVAWVISGYQSVQSSNEFVQATLEFHNKGGGLLIWGDNDPYFAHANVLLPSLLKVPIKLIGNTPGGKTMNVGDPNKTQSFGPHIITTGVIKLFEGITICYPVNNAPSVTNEKTLGPLKVLATSSDGHPAVSYADNESLSSNTCGRVIVDCGWTKMYCSWKEAGTARYISNATIWLLGLEHKLSNEGDLELNNNNNSTTSTTSTSMEKK